MFGNAQAMSSSGADRHRPSGRAPSKSLLFWYTFFFSKAKSKRFCGAARQARTLGKAPVPALPIGSVGKSIFLGNCLRTDQVPLVSPADRHTGRGEVRALLSFRSVPIEKFSRTGYVLLGNPSMHHRSGPPALRSAMRNIVFGTEVKVYCLNPVFPQLPLFQRCYR
ncbi:hypothetical protein SAMN05421636_1276 [Pricia antarctica]|uniref:Uncharacterized protein n=1 Tax=Pricia antarctica TaxID=641691 RepID=A0A1G7JGY8_9FLAO|nr:hypothetical protein SAMN05421636_1276 [Pricia antarctica]